MKMYKDEHEAYVDKEQVELMESTGWTRKKAAPVVKTPVSNDSSDVDTDSDENVDSDEDVDTDEPLLTTKKTKIIKKK